MSFTSPEEIINAFEGLKILVIGDVMTDSYLYGNVKRISPEAPVPVVSVQKRERRLGGAANVALNLKALGAKPIICSVIGNDDEGDTLISLLKEADISSEGIIRAKNRPTTVKHRILSGSQHILRIDSETETPIDAISEKNLLEKIKELIPDCAAVIIEDYDKGVLNESVIPEIIQTAGALNIPTAVDPKRKNFLFYKNTNLFKPNLKELKEGLNIDFDSNDLEAVKKATLQLSEKLNAKKVLITLSEKGVLACEDGQTHHIPAHLREISDVSGAGDTVISVAALCLAVNVPLKTLAELSNLAGGLVCEYIGVVSIDKQQLLKEANKHLLSV